MWFMNQIANPMVRLILRSPLHRMMSASLLLITYVGRKSGKEYTLPVQYVQDNRTIYIVPGTPEKKIWWRNLRQGAAAKLWLAGRALVGKAVVLEGSPEGASITQALDIYMRRFPAAAKIDGIRVAQDGANNQDDLRRVALSMVVVRVDLEP